MCQMVNILCEEILNAIQLAENDETVKITIQAEGSVFSVGRSGGDEACRR